MTTTTRPLVLNVTEAGNLLGVSRSTAYELVRSGDLKSVKLRRRVVVPVAAIADRLGITVPDIWLSLAQPPNSAPLDIDLHDHAVPDVLIEETPKDLDAELTRRSETARSITPAVPACRAQACGGIEVAGSARQGPRGR